MYLDPTLPGCTVFGVHDDILVYNMYSIIVHFVYIYIYIFHESEVLLIQGAFNVWFEYRMLFLYIVQYNCTCCIVVQYHCHFLTQCNIITQMW